MHPRVSTKNRRKDSFKKLRAKPPFSLIEAGNLFNCLQSVLPEFVITAACHSVLGRSTFTFKRSKEAKAVAEMALQKIDTVELNVVEDYITKHDFQGTMNRLLDSMSKIKKTLNNYQSGWIFMLTIKQSY